MRKLVVFDFDGTLSWPDTNAEFWRFSMRRSIRAWIFLPTTIIGFIMKWRDLRNLYISKRFLARHRDDFIKHHLKNRFGWAADQVAKERAGGNFVVLVSASPDYFIKPLVRDMKFDLVLASVMDKARPWKLKFFCHDENKVVALRRAMGKKPFEIVRAYADSKSDVPIMSLAIEPVWIDRDTGLRR